MKPIPNWLDKNLYPFQSKWTAIDGHDLHYIDEGQGDVIVFVHGTPEWSFGYRDLVKHLRQSFRCIAIDLLGFGLSDKPQHADYSCQAHAARFEKFMATLGMKKISLVANDFGGGIALSYALNHPEHIDKIVLFNTWMWSLKNDRHYSTPARLMNTWLGKKLYLDFNFPVNVIMPSAYGDKKKLTGDVHAHYKNALKKGERTAAYRFSQELMKASDWWQHLWENMQPIEGKPFLIFWGMKDSFIPPRELDKWRSKLPDAHVVTFDDAGHFVQEEKPVEMIAAIDAFMKNKVSDIPEIKAAKI
jgi:pimeloyl-ACP methyl ester carboxylesterase